MLLQLPIDQTYVVHTLGTQVGMDHLFWSDLPEHFLLEVGTEMNQSQKGIAPGRPTALTVRY